MLEQRDRLEPLSPRQSLVAVLFCAGVSLAVSFLVIELYGVDWHPLWLPAGNTTGVVIALTVAQIWGRR